MALCAALLLVLPGGAYVCYRFIRHEKIQDGRIRQLEATVLKLRERSDALQGSDAAFWLDGGFNYLAIGNSITLHGKTSFWWNDVGMAASDAEHDYFHLVLQYLRKSRNCQVMGQSFNFAAWEVHGHDRDETLSLLDPYLSPKLNVVTVQLGENVTDLATYEADFVSLIAYIQKKAPVARLVIVGDFWDGGEKLAMKARAAAKSHADYVSLADIMNDKEYQCGLGTVVYDASGGAHVVEHAGVAQHPGDKGMQTIAERIIAVLESQ